MTVTLGLGSNSGTINSTSQAFVFSKRGASVFSEDKWIESINIAHKLAFGVADRPFANILPKLRCTKPIAAPSSSDILNQF
jgi:hypothetical protein